MLDFIIIPQQPVPQESGKNNTFKKTMRFRVCVADWNISFTFVRNSFCLLFPKGVSTF
jgi:hypothetical protein